MSVEGLLNVDKPQGITSHDVVSRLRRLSKVRRIGHAGTLDPLATGVLILCVGRATRLLEYVVGQTKTYEATIRLGQVTDTYDADGMVVAERPVSVEQTEISAILGRFRGRIQQQAPRYSAIKRDGQPLYKLAREGKQFDPPIREVQIDQLELLSWESPYLQVSVVCSTGTYIRSLAYDVGEALGCGGHITMLRRSAVGVFDARQAIKLADLDEGNWMAYLQPADTAVHHLPRLDLSQEDANRVLLGQRIPREDEHPAAVTARIYDADGRFLGLVVPRENTWQPHKIFHPEFR